MSVRYPPIERSPLRRVSEGSEPRPSLQRPASRRPTGLTIVTDLSSGSYSNSSAEARMLPGVPYRPDSAWHSAEEGAGPPKASCLRRCPARVWGFVRRIFGSRSGQAFRRMEGPNKA